MLVVCAGQGLGAKKKLPAHPINLNTASSTQLQELPGIGPSTAEKILQARKSYGAFKSVDDLQAIKGIGPKKLEKIKKYLTVKPAQAGANSTPPTQAAAAAKKSPATKTTLKPDTPAKTPPATANENEEQ